MSDSSALIAREFHLSEIQSVAGELCAYIRAGMNLALVGELGAGKTTLVRAILKTLGSEDLVSSPTYVLEHQYSTASNLVVQHWDLYRLSVVPAELLDPHAPDSLRLIEWADKFPEVLRACDLHVDLSFGQIGSASFEIGGDARFLRVSRNSFGA